VHLGQEVEERVAVVGPLLLELGGGRVLAAGELQRDLEAVGVQVVEVLREKGR